MAPTSVSHEAVPYPFPPKNPTVDVAYSPDQYVMSSDSPYFTSSVELETVSRVNVVVDDPQEEQLSTVTARFELPVSAVRAHELLAPDESVKVTFAAKSE